MTFKKDCHVAKAHRNDDTKIFLVKLKIPMNHFKFARPSSILAVRPASFL